METIKTSKVVVGIVGALLILPFAQIAAQLSVSLFVLIQIPEAICNAAAGILYTVITYLLLKVCAEKLLKMPLADLAIPKCRIEIKWIVTAFALPLLVTAVYLLFPGKLQKGNIELTEAIVTICAGIFYIGFAAGVVEETVFRGFIMNLLDKKLGRKWAVLLPSLLFGLVHIVGMDFSVLSCLQVVVAGTFVGIMFSFITLERRSVWNSAVVHALWNMIILGGFLSIGESPDAYVVYSYVLETDSFAVTGGEFGIEASVIAIVGYLVVAFIAYIGGQKNSK